MSGKAKRVRFCRSGLRWLWPVAGFVSVLWFLVRVIPKPSRATYPCQRVAFPIASSFVIWLIHIAGLVVIVKKGRFLLKDPRFVGVIFLLAVVFVAVSYTPDGSWYVPSDSALNPIGTPRGHNPGRVVWTYNPDATSWDGSTGYWYDAVDQSEVDQMLSDTLMDLVEAADDAGAWDLIFRHYNRNHGKGTVGYQTNETIVIKLNLNGMKNTNHIYAGNGQLTSPQVVLSLLRQLVNQAGVDDANITFYDVSRYIPDVIYDRCKAEFPNVHFADFSGGDGREQAQKDLAAGEIDWSDDLQDPTEVGGGNPAYLPTCVTAADYFINLANLKGHSLAGVTVCAKNHFGSFIADPDPEYPSASAEQMPKNAGVHPYIAVHDYGGASRPEWDFDKREMGTYNALVDLMGHADLGGKTILYLIDGLYAANNQGMQLSADCKWQSEPFCDDDGWSSSLFASQDPVAIDSVALDFLRSETTIQEYNNVMNAGDTVDNFLHEAALADNPPSGAFYDPEGDAVRMKSLGVHEHWNNPVERLYSGNLHPGEGIELIRSPTAPDFDRDGLPDEWELQYYGGITNANPAVLCSNGVDTVMAAYVAGFDPVNPLACFTITAQQFDATNTIYWDGVTGRVYSVYWSSDLLAGFQLLDNQVHWSSNVFSDTQHSDVDEGFYKLHVDLISQ